MMEEIYKPGTTLYIRTVNYARVGTVVAISPREIYLHPCVDVIESGGFEDFFGGTIRSYARVKSSEKYPSCVMRGAITNIDHWPNEIPDEAAD
jgi:hypothetical protein